MNNKLNNHVFVGSQKDGLPVFKTEDETYFVKKADGTRTELESFRHEKTVNVGTNFHLMFGFDSDPTGAGSKNLNLGLMFHP